MDNPKIVNIQNRFIVGKNIHTTLATNDTIGLWQQFRPKVHTIPNRLGTDFFSVHVYPDNFRLENFTLETKFQKWAAVEVSSFDDIPNEFDVLTLTGKYAVFMHHGPANVFEATLNHIYNEWLPGSGFQLDARPHFEILPANYRPDDPNAWEEVWRPIIEMD